MIMIRGGCHHCRPTGVQQLVDEWALSTGPLPARYERL
jgi:hypothetical protein